MPARQEAPFVRLWRGFLIGRIVVAAALTLMQALGWWMTENTPTTLTLVCAAYLAATLLARWLGGREPPAAAAGPQWLPTIGLDIAVICLLQALQIGNMNYTPLFALPILMASMLGTLTLALGVTATITLLLLGWIGWQDLGGSVNATQAYFQTALTGTGYFIVAFLTHQLAQRLTGAQLVAQQSQLAAHLQAQVNALVIQHLSDGVLVLGEDNTVHAGNPAALELLGLPATQPLPFSLAAQSAWSPLLALAQHTFATDQPEMREANLVRSGHSPIGLHMRTWLTDTHDAAPDVQSDRLCVMFLHDLRETQARLRTEKLAAMGRMSAAVAHEIRNPLAAIVQANALLGEDLREPGQQRLSHMVQQNAERLARITEDVLDIARVQHQASAAPGPTLALDEAVAHIWGEWQAHAPARRRAALSLQAPHAWVEFEPEHLRRVLVNLLDNALRYMGHDSDSLQIATHTAPADQDSGAHSSEGHATLTVWSDGPPLDKSVERHLFEPFFSSESRSSGLGLYICRELCQRHGAAIRYQRMERATTRGLVQGNAFAVALRLAPAPAASATLFDN